VKRSVLTLLALSAFATTTAHSAPELVGLAETFRAGTIVVRKHERLLYYVTGVGQAVRYPIGVGRIATQWTGASSRYDALWWRTIHSRHQRAKLSRALRSLWLYPLFNEDIADLYRRVGVGTPVIVE
jgi:lipoprotein-anchoring transpeptidase ErfK/SrfK